MPPKACGLKLKARSWRATDEGALRLKVAAARRGLTQEVMLDRLLMSLGLEGEVEPGDGGVTGNTAGGESVASADAGASPAQPIRMPDGPMYSSVCGGSPPFRGRSLEGAGVKVEISLPDDEPLAAILAEKPVSSESDETEPAVVEANAPEPEPPPAAPEPPQPDPEPEWGASQAEDAMDKKLRLNPLKVPLDLQGRFETPLWRNAGKWEDDEGKALPAGIVKLIERFLGQDKMKLEEVE